MDNRHASYCTCMLNIPGPPTSPLDSINSPNQLNSGYEDIKLSEAGTMEVIGMVGAKILLLICNLKQPEKQNTIKVINVTYIECSALWRKSSLSTTNKQD